MKDLEEDEKEDFNIKPDDNLIVAGHVDQDFSTLEISGDYDLKSAPDMLNYIEHYVLMCTTYCTVMYKKIHVQCTYEFFSTGIYFFFSVYNEEEGSQYVHHDILLEAFPLTIEWLDFDPEDPSKPGVSLTTLTDN